MSTTTPGFAQVFFLTERDPVWNGAKSVAFPVIADGALHTYMVDLREANVPGIVTRLRLDPSWAAGQPLAVDHIRATGNLDVSQPPPIASPAPPLELTLASEASNDGWVIESAAGSNVGGSSSSSGSTFPRAIRPPTRVIGRCSRSRPAPCPTTLLSSARALGSRA